MKIQKYETEFYTERMKNSLNGNPRYKLFTMDGLEIGRTGIDSSIAYRS